ncbi:MAG: hypothetical protein KDI80_17380, partial [Xanthomonadales bacterium]|nr:hypothetical protein [Xanthomonadales bacterium]
GAPSGAMPIATQREASGINACPEPVEWASPTMGAKEGAGFVDATRATASLLEEPSGSMLHSAQLNLPR